MQGFSIFIELLSDIFEALGKKCITVTEIGKPFRIQGNVNAHTWIQALSHDCIAGSDWKF